MSDKEVRAQLERMVQFIKKEAEEKAQEIRDKAHEEFSIEKQRLVQAEKLKILKEYERKEKQVEVQRKMCAFFLLFIREPAFRFPPHYMRYNYNCSHISFLSHKSTFIELNSILVRIRVRSMQVA